jgi:uncharacterized surface protein with fasciclin (FAS1) repeats
MFKKFLFPTVLVALSAGFSSCEDEEEDITPTEQNILELAQGNSDLTSLVAAVQRAGLTDALADANAQLTVFAPTNAAFSTFLQANGFADVNAVPVDVLKQIILNHVVNTEVMSTDLTTGYVSTLATFGTAGPNLSLYMNTTGGVTLNGTVGVTTADVDASNGVVHVVDEVIALPTVVTVATSNPDFSTLVAALTRPGLSTNFVNVLSGTGPFTVFAPTNAAFSALLTELGASDLNAIDNATLEAVLLYHVASGNVRSTDLSNGMMVTSLGGGDFTINLGSGATITDGQGRVSNITATDVQSNNGVVHVIDKVIMP